MFIIKYGGKILEGTEGIKFSSEQRAMDYLFDNKFYLIKGNFDNGMKEVWHNFSCGTIFPHYGLQIIRLNSENDTVQEIANLLNSINSNYNLIINNGNKILVTDENGDKFVLTCNKEQEEN